MGQCSWKSSLIDSYNLEKKWHLAAVSTEQNYNCFCSLYYVIYGFSHYATTIKTKPKTLREKKIYQAQSEFSFLSLLLSTAK